MYQSVW